MGRDCNNCIHYVKSNEGNTEALFGELHSCEKWECKFEPKVIPVAEIEKILKRFELRMPPTVYIDLLSDILNYEEDIR